MRALIEKLDAQLKPQLTRKAPAMARLETVVEHGDGDTQRVSGERASGSVPARGVRLRSQVCGAAILLVTTVLWASGGPTSRYLFLLPAPPSAALLTACISVVTALFLGVGLLGSAMEAGGRTRRRHRHDTQSLTSPTVSGPEGLPGNAAAGAAAAVAAAAGVGGGRQSRSRHRGGGGRQVEFNADEAEAEAFLHSGMHTTGAAGGALAAATAAAREAAQEVEQQLRREREHAWARAQECALPLLPSQGSHYFSSQLTSLSYSLGDVAGPTDLEPGTAGSVAVAGGGTGAAAGSSREPTATQRVLRAALAVGETGHSGRNRGNGVGAGGAGEGSGAGDGVAQHMAHEGLHVRRGPSLDGTTAGPAAMASPPPPLRPQAAASLVCSSDCGPQVTATPRRSMGGGTSAGGGRWRLRLLAAPARSLVAAGVELGVYNVTAAALGAWGMQRISATRSAFLTQATSLLTPLLVWLSGGRVGSVVWVACCCGALGGAMVALDNVYGTASAAAGRGGGGPSHQLLLTPLLNGDVADPLGLHSRALLSGEAITAAAAAHGRWAVEGVLLSRQAMGAAYVLLSCMFWGVGTVRLGVHSARYPPLNLAAAAAVSYAGMSLLWLLYEVVGSPSAGLSDFLELRLLLRNHVTAALLLWAGLGPGALSSYLQVLGQQTVPPAQAQVMFSSTPLWSALIAQLLLPGEAMGPLAWAGGGVMLAASLLASLWQ